MAGEESTEILLAHLLPGARENSMTPLEIELCLHYHSSPLDAPWIYSGNALVDKTMIGLHNSGLLADANDRVPRERKWKATPKLHAFVALLCATPFPIQVFSDPRTNEVITSRPK